MKKLCILCFLFCLTLVAPINSSAKNVTITKGKTKTIKVKKIKKYKIGVSKKKIVKVKK